MVPGNRQPKWDIYEAVILLDGYLDVLNANQTKVQIVKRVSADLRQMAVNRGIEIDDIYRNENGISYQIQSMASAYRGEKIYIPATKLFVEAVELYRTETERYFDILEEARNMIAAKRNNKEDFLAWTASVLPPKRCKWIEQNILRVEQFAIATKVISGSIFDITDTATLVAIYKAAGKNRIFQIKNRKLIKNINDDFKAYMQYCSQLTELAEQVTDTEPAVVETPAVYLEMTAEENLIMQYQILGIPNYDGIADLLKLVGLADCGKKKAKDFSLGMKQRLGIAVALCGSPDFLILDEPVNGLDPQGIIEIRELILKLNRDFQITILISSHILGELSKLATHYGFVDGGRIVKEISAAELEANCRKCVHLSVTNAKALCRVLDGMNIEYTLTSDAEADIYGEIGITQLTLALAKENCEVKFIQKRDESLENYYMNLIGGQANA